MSWGAACHQPLPSWPQALQTGTGGDTRQYDISGDGQVDYTQRLNDGRKTTFAFDDDQNGRPDEEARWDAPDPAWPHYLIVLDGVPFALVEEMWHEGRFRLFPRPSKVISVFPPMTDLALSTFFHAGPCIALESAYLDREKNRLSDGTAVLYSGVNSPWLKKLNYHLPEEVAARVYLDPQGVFERELREMKKTFDVERTGLVSGYSVATAGLGTRGGREGIRAYLATIDDFCERLVYERRGRVRLTITADHGHTLVPPERIGYKSHLTARGFRLTNSLKKPKDVVEIKYGLITCTAFYSREPAELADALVEHGPTDLVVYPQGDEVVVLSAGGRARVGNTGGGFTYVADAGDPLGLVPIIDQLRGQGNVSAEGAIDDRAFFEATAGHVYPDPLHRLWACFHGLVQQPPDLIVSLKDAYCHGYWMFEIGIGKVASTHGSLNAINTNAFVLSTAAPLPPALRIEDVLPAVQVSK